MLYPSINELLKKIDNRYSLVVAVSKRARNLIEGDEALVRLKEEKPVTVAVNEIDAGKVIAVAATNLNEDGEEIEISSQIQEMEILSEDEE